MGMLVRYEVQGRYQWKARYFKVVELEENTLGFGQEIHNEQDILVKVRHKGPVDLGHTAPLQEDE